MITLTKEIKDIQRLSKLIREDAWLSSSTILVNCSPDYSSILCQVLNHSLSTENENELYEQITMEMPYPTMSQVWDKDSREYLPFDRYLSNWVRSISSSYSYLFLDSGCLRGKNFSKVKSLIKDRLSPSQYRFACLYLEEGSIFLPDYYVEKVDKDSLIFEWENPLNPNWNY